MQENNDQTPCVTEITQKDLVILQAAKQLLSFDEADKTKDILTEMFLYSLRSDLNGHQPTRELQIALFENLSDFYRTIKTVDND